MTTKPVVAARAVQQIVGEQPADLVAAEAPPRPVGLRDRRPEPVGVRIVGDRHMGAGAAGELQQEIHRARLLRVRERHRGKRPVGLELLGDDVRLRQSGRRERPQHHRAADAVHRGVGDRHAGEIGPSAHGWDRRHVRRDQLLPHRMDQRMAVVSNRYRCRIDGFDPLRDADVVWGNDLGAVAEIHLVPVVRRRVVGRGDHDAGGGIQLGDRPCQHGCRHLLVEEHRLDPVGRHHARRVGREHVALATRVVPDHDAALATIRVGVEQVLGEPCRRLTDDEPVHAQGSRTDRRRAVLPCRTSVVRRNARRARPRARRSGPHLVADISIGLGLEPCPSACAHVVRGAHFARPVMSVPPREAPATRRSRARRTRGPTSETIQSSVRSSTSGLGPTWLITSAAAIEPRCPASASDAPDVRPNRNPEA